MELDMFEEEISSFSVGDEEFAAEDNKDEIAADVDISDALAVDDVICEAHLSICLDALPVTEANIRHVCIAKVNCIYRNGWYVWSTDSTLFVTP
jgi:hypothetical protein